MLQGEKPKRPLLEEGEDGQMILRGMTAAAALIASAVFLLEFTRGEAAEPREADTLTMGMAPLAIGNPATATELASLGDGRPVIGGYGAASSTERTPQTFTETFTVKSGDTLGKLLKRAGADGRTADAAIRSLNGVFDPRTLRAGQSIDIIYAPLASGDNADRFFGFEIPLDYARSVRVESTEESVFHAVEIEKELKTQHVRAEGVIDWSLFASGTDAGVPVNVMTELVRAFSWDVDFQRDIRKNDGFEVMFEQKIDEHGQPVHNGKIVFAALTLSGDRKPIYLHQMADGRWDYFDDNGQSAKKALMRTPIDGARLSSHFGKRKHPILGYTKQHTGTDFAAPPGTPIYAAGDGVIDYAAWKGGYGKYIRIRHNSEYSTAYAHMRAFAKGMGKGKRVRQGQIIGYVGTTGQSTGPHLHYEIIHNGVKVNPMRVKMPSGEKLKGLELAKFEETRQKLERLWASLPATGPRLAQR